MNNQIQDEINRVKEASKKNDQSLLQDAALNLLGEFLTDFKRIANSLEKTEQTLRSR